MPPAYEVLLLNTAVPQIQAAQAGDTYVVPRDIAFSAALTLSAGTANGVPYLNGSKVLTSGSALTFDGTALGMSNGGAVNIGGNVSLYGDANQTVIRGRTTNGIIFQDQAGTGEWMRLTSTGLGIGTSSPANRLDVVDAANFAPIRLTSAAGTNIRFDTTRNFTVNRNWIIGCDQLSEGAFAIIPSTAIGGGTFSNAVYTVGSNGIHIWSNGSGSERMRLDSSGNLGLGVTPSAFDTAQKALQVLNGSFYSDASSTGLQYNSFYNGTNEKYIADGYATSYYQSSGQHSWRTAASGTAGGNISFTQALTLDANRNLLLNGTSAGASAVGTLAIFNGTAPTGSVTDGIILYAEDVSSSSELKVRDEAGNVTTLSPHNFSLIPEGPSEDMAWAYYSEKAGKRINVDMLKLARMVEQLTGEKLVYEA